MLIRLSFFLVLLSSGNAIGQVNRYVVYFKNKAGNQYSVSQPAKFLSTASITRRTRQQIGYTDEDLPVTAAYVSKLKDIGAKVFFTSRWLNCVLVESTPSIATAASQLPEVSKVELVAPGNRLLGGRVATKFDQKVTDVTAPSLVQFQQLGIDDMNSQGYNGEGINIAIFDGGFLGVNTTSAFQAARSKIKYEYNFVVNSKNVYLYDDHGTEVFSILSAQTPDFVGGSLGANYFLFLTEDKPTEYRVEEFNWLFAAERADSLGVDIISSSLGYSTFDDATMNYQISDLTGNNAIVSIAASKALAKGMMVVTSAGNEGNSSWKYITPPADASGILSVGSITSDKSLSGFSSLGPTADGRFKPDVVALGSSTSLINQSGSLVKGSGTSFSCPLVTCLVAGLWQAYPNLKAQEIYNAIVRSADQAYNPDNKKGFGLPNFKAVVNYLKRTALDQAIVISPNPVETSMNVTFKEPKEEEVVMTIFSVLGQPLFTQSTTLNWQKNPMEYDLSNLASGVYIVQIKSLSQSLTSRIIKF
jgi:serine protease AprX